MTDRITPEIATVLNAWANDGPGETVARHKSSGSEPAPGSISEFAQQGMQGTPGSLPYQSQLEAAFGQPLSDIKVYQGERANQAASALNAEAYAHRGAIVLGGGADLKTVAEETTHVLQQRSGKLGGSGGLTDPAGPAEIEASRVADTVASGGVAPTIGSSLESGAVARKKGKKGSIGPKGVRRGIDGSLGQSAAAQGFKKDGPLQKVKANNHEVSAKLRNEEAGEWKKCYQDGHDANGEEASLHYFESPSGKVFNAKVKIGWSS